MAGYLDTGGGGSGNVPAGGTTGQVLAKNSNTDQDVEWISATGLGDLVAANNLSDVASAVTARTNLGLGTAAVAATGDFATAAQGTTADNAVPKSLYDANTVLYATADNTPAALTVGASTFVGRKATGDIAAMSAAEAAALLTSLVPKATFPETIAIACSDMATAITTGTTKAYWVAPWACTLTAVKATLATAGTGTGTTIDINEGAGAGTSVLSTKLTIDVSETDSADATTPAVISDSAIAANGRITIDFDAVGTGAAGVIVYLTVTRGL